MNQCTGYVYKVTMLLVQVTHDNVIQYYQQNIHTQDCKQFLQPKWIKIQQHTHIEMQDIENTQIMCI